MLLAVKQHPLTLMRVTVRIIHAESSFGSLYLQNHSAKASLLFYLLVLPMYRTLTPRMKIFGPYVFMNICSFQKTLLDRSREYKNLLSFFRNKDYKSGKMQYDGRAEAHSSYRRPT